ncbi:hypothetical protein [Priestia aryabhattai]|uniref:hypothetical protein n=1 Tax=Priestia aryabhattai TaxID=412384 RepID=UPI003D2AEF7E
MANSAKVKIINEITSDEHAVGSHWVLCLQWCKYIYNDGASQMGFRFIWRRPDGSLQAARGQARIPNLEIANSLIEKAMKLGWGHNSSSNEKVDNT